MFFGFYTFKKPVTYIKNPHDELVLVNKYNKLTRDFVPLNLKEINNVCAFEEQLVLEKVKISFEKLCFDAYKLGLKIIVVSSYRSFNYQTNLYNYYVKHFGIKHANLISAKPGHSEHQTGLAIDVMGSNGNYNEFAKTDEFIWMKDNAHKYGFILRYPQNKKKTTGYKYEPWHYRYVGIEVANYIYIKNITLEQYKKTIKQ